MISLIILIVLYIVWSVWNIVCFLRFFKILKYTKRDYQIYLWDDFPMLSFAWLMVTGGAILWYLIDNAYNFIKTL